MKKKAQDLKPGDVLPEGRTHKRSVVLQRIGSDGIDVRYALGVLGEDRSIRRWFPVADDVEVESPTLTPAQQHAEELLDIVRDVQTFMPNLATGMKAKELLVKIDPPKPPSVEELAEALAEMMGDGKGIAPRIDKRALLERARAAGYLKQEAQ